MSETHTMPPPTAAGPVATPMNNGLQKVNPWAAYTVPDSLKSLEQLMATKRTTKVKLVLLSKSQSLSMADGKSVAQPRARARGRPRLTSRAPNATSAQKDKEVKLIIRNEEKGTTEKINIKKCPDDEAEGSVGGWGDVMQHLKMEQSAVKIDIEDPDFGAAMEDATDFPGSGGAGNSINDYVEEDGGDDWYGDGGDYEEDFPGDFPAPEVKIETVDAKDGQEHDERSETDGEEEEDADSDYCEKPSKVETKRKRPKRSQVGKCNNTKWSRASTWTRGKWKLKTKKGEEEAMVETKPDAKMTAISLDAYVVRDIIEDPRKKNKAEAAQVKNVVLEDDSVQGSSQDLPRLNEDGNGVWKEAEGRAAGELDQPAVKMADCNVGDGEEAGKSSGQEPKEEPFEEREMPADVKGEDMDEGMQRTYRDRRLFACPFCPFVSCKKIWLAHIKRLHDDPDKRQLLWCKITPKKCGMPFTDEASRELHVREVHIAAHQCSVCGREFKFPYMLRDHMSNMHGTKVEKMVNLDYGTKSFVCTYCGKNFGSKSGMASHEANHHTGQFRHKCHLCGKGFFNKHVSFRLTYFQIMPADPSRHSLTRSAPNRRAADIGEDYLLARPKLCTHMA